MRHDSDDAETHMIQLAHTFGDTDDVLMVVYVLYVTAVVTLRLMIDTYYKLPHKEEENQISHSSQSLY